MNPINNLTVISYNCRNVKSSINVLNELCETGDILLLQETWLCDFELNFLNSIHENFYGVGVSAVDTSSGLLVGRPHGGVAILWRKCLASRCRVIEYADSRLLGIQFTDESGGQYLFINVYLPYECPDNYDNYMHYLGKIASIINNSTDGCIYVLGDFNAHINSVTSRNFGSELLSLCDEESLVLSDLRFLGLDTKEEHTFTFISEAHHTTSWLDHCISNSVGHSNINNMEVLYKYVSSDHLPLLLNIKCKNIKDSTSCATSSCKPCIKWSKLSDNVISQYQANTSSYFDSFVPDDNILYCKNTNCNLPDHLQSIDTLYDYIVKSLCVASESLLQKPYVRDKQKPGWNMYCKDAYQQKRDAFILWKESGKPRAGPIYMIYKRSSLNFKYMMRFRKSQEAQILSNKLAQEMSAHDYDSFWKTVKKCNESKSCLPNTINGTSGVQNIAEMWGQHFQSLLNVSTDTSLKAQVLSNCHNTEYNEECVVTVSEVLAAIKSSKSGKSPDHHGINSEHFKYACNRVPAMLSFLFTAILVHGYLPKNFMLSSLIPIVKNRSGDLTSKDNYRPIAINSVVSKLFEIILLNRYSDLFLTSENQFGFKRKSSTDMCIFMFKQVVEYYRNLSSSVYVCFLDASKAFDRVNHWSLLHKLCIRRVPSIIIRILKYWFTQQTFCVKWGSASSELFRVTNGLRQGGILSPVMFNVYLDCLSIKLAASKIGCKFVDKTVNHLMYADDMTILAPSAKGLQRLLSICESYANSHEMVFNSSKSVFMCIESKHNNSKHIPSVSLKSVPLFKADSYKYLGFTITKNYSDSVDIKKQMRNVYARANMLNAKFFNSSNDVKSMLFQAYCTNIYCTHLWWNYTCDVYKKFVVAYNNCFRRLLGYKLSCSASNMFLCNNVLHFSVLRRKSLCNFMSRLKLSENALIRCVYMSRPMLQSTFYKEWCDKLYI